MLTSLTRRATTVNKRADTSLNVTTSSLMTSPQRHQSGRYYNSHAIVMQSYNIAITGNMMSRARQVIDRPLSR